ncbi:MAG: ATP synthase F1 subunit delta [Patescibacteria group bacterium]
MPAKDIVFLNQLATAYLEELGDREEQDRALGELTAIAEAFRGDESFRDTLLNPALSVTERKKFLRTALDNRVQTKTLNTLLTLLHEHRLADLALFIDRVRAVRMHKHAVRDALVTSAVPLLDKERERIKTALEQKWGTAVALREHVDPSLIAGLTIEAADWHYDATVAGRLKRLGQHLVTTSTT